MLRNIVDAFSSSPRSQSPIAERAASSQENADTPFTKFVLSRLGEESAKLFAVSFAEHVRNDPDQKNLEFSNIFSWLGYSRKSDAVKFLKKCIRLDQIVLQKCII